MPLGTGESVMKMGWAAESHMSDGRCSAYWQCTAIGILISLLWEKAHYSSTSCENLTRQLISSIRQGKGHTVVFSCHIIKRDSHYTFCFCFFCTANFGTWVVSSFAHTRLALYTEWYPHLARLFILLVCFNNRSTLIFFLLLPLIHCLFLLVSRSLSTLWSKVHLWNSPVPFRGKSPTVNSFALLLRLWNVTTKFTTKTANLSLGHSDQMTYILP